MSTEMLTLQQMTASWLRKYPLQWPSLFVPGLETQPEISDLDRFVDDGGREPDHVRRLKALERAR